MNRQINIRKEFEGTDNSYNLDWSKKSLISLRGISSFSHVIHLNLSDNKLSDLSPLSDCRELEYLNVSNNSLTTINSLERLLNLRILNLRRNQVKRIENLHNLLKLEILDLSSNSISKIENLSDNLGLKCLLLGFNGIREIEDLFHLHQLVTLDLKSNQISTLKDVSTSLSGSIQTLNLENNKLRSLFEPFYLRTLSNIRHLVVQGNPFVSTCEEKKINFRALTIYFSDLLLDSLDYGEVSDEDITMVNDLKRRRVLELDLSKEKPSDSYLVDLFKLEAPENAYRVQIVVPQQRGRQPAAEYIKGNETINGNFPMSQTRAGHAPNGFGDTVRSFNLSSSKANLKGDQDFYVNQMNSSQVNGFLSESRVFLGNRAQNNLNGTAGNILHRNQSGGSRMAYQDHQQRNRSGSPSLSAGMRMAAFGEVEELKEEIRVLRKQVRDQRKKKSRKARIREDSEEAEEDEENMEEQARKMKRHHKRSTRRNPKIYALTLSYDKKLLDRIRRYYEKLLEIKVSSSKASKEQQTGNKELIRLQAWFRGSIIRDKILLNQFSNRSATLIQAVWRGFHVRKAFSSIQMKKKKKSEDESHVSVNNGANSLKAVNGKLKEAEGRIENLESVLRNLIAHFGEMQEKIEKMEKEKEEKMKEDAERQKEQEKKAQEENERKLAEEQERKKKNKRKEMEVQTVPEKVTNGTNTEEVLEFLTGAGKEKKTKKRETKEETEENEDDKWLDEEEEPKGIERGKIEKKVETKEAKEKKLKEEEETERKNYEKKSKKKSRTKNKKKEPLSKGNSDEPKAKKKRKREREGESDSESEREDEPKRKKRPRKKGSSSGENSESEESHPESGRKAKKKPKGLKYAQEWAKGLDKKRGKRQMSSRSSQSSSGSSELVEKSESVSSQELDELERRKRAYKRRQMGIAQMKKREKEERVKRVSETSDEEDYEEEEKQNDSEEYSSREEEEVGYNQQYERQIRESSLKKKQMGSPIRPNSKSKGISMKMSPGYYSSSVSGLRGANQGRNISNYSSQRPQGNFRSNIAQNQMDQSLPKVLKKPGTSAGSNLSGLKGSSMTRRPLTKAELQPGAILRNSQISNRSSSSSRNQSIERHGKLPSWAESARKRGESHKRESSSGDYLDIDDAGSSSTKTGIRETKKSKIHVKGMERLQVNKSNSKEEKERNGILESDELDPFYNGSHQNDDYDQQQNEEGSNQAQIDDEDDNSEGFEPENIKEKSQMGSNTQIKQNEAKKTQGTYQSKKTQGPSQGNPASSANGTPHLFVLSNKDQPFMSLYSNMSMGKPQGNMSSASRANQATGYASPSLSGNAPKVKGGINSYLGRPGSGAQNKLGGSSVTQKGTSGGMGISGKKATGEIKTGAGSTMGPVKVGITGNGKGVSGSSFGLKPMGYGARLGLAKK